MSKSALYTYNIKLHSSDNPNIHTVKIDNLNSGKYVFKLISLTDNKVNLDGFVLGNMKEVRKTIFNQIKWNHVPEIIQGSTNNSIILKYKDSSKYYGIVWNYPVADSDIREFLLS